MVVSPYPYDIYQTTHKVIDLIQNLKKAVYGVALYIVIMGIFWVSNVYYSLHTLQKHNQRC